MTGIETTGTGLIRIVVGVMRNAAGQVLLVRKHGSAVFMQPGGKREAREGTLTTLHRELDEELGVQVTAQQRLGMFEARAVHERGCRVQAEAFLVEWNGTPMARSEIAEARWAHPLPPWPFEMAPLSAHHILPALRAFLVRQEASPQG